MSLKNKKVKTNICRPLAIYNKLMPYNPASTLQFEYVVLGEYDAIQEGYNLFAEDNMNISFEKLKDDLLIKLENLDGGFAPQLFYCFRTEYKDKNIFNTEKEKITDEEFWKNDKKDIFLFITTLHIVPDNEDNQSFDILFLKEDLEKAFNTGRGDKSLKAICYLTLENNDMILCIKTSEYKKAAKIIYDFHRKKNVIKVKNKNDKIRKFIVMFTHTTCGIHKENVSYILENQEKYKDLLETTLDEINFFIAERNAKAMSELKKQLDSHLQSNKYLQIMGNEDIKLTYYDVKLKKFLQLFDYKQNGSLTTKNETYNKAIYHVSTQIVQKQDENSSFILELDYDRENFQIYPKDSIKVSNLRKILMEAICENPDNKKIKEIYKTLLHILNTLEQYEHLPFSNYIYVSIINPLAMLIRNKELFVNKTNNVKIFIECIERIFQTAISTSRHFYQVPDYSMYNNDIPIKLSAFYVAYADLVCQFLKNFSEELENGRKHQYQFLITPSMETKELTHLVFPMQKPSDRVLIMEIPELEMFNPFHVTRVIVHEVSHYVGGKTRNRKLRFDIIIDIVVNVCFCSLMCYSIKEYRGEVENKDSEWRMKDFYSQTGMNKFKRLLKSRILDALNSKDNREKWAKSLGYPKIEDEDIIYLNVTEAALQDILTDMINIADSQNLFNTIFTEYILNSKKKTISQWDERHRFEVLKQSYFLDMCEQKISGEVIEHTKKTIIDFSKRGNYILKLMSETYADFSMILTLKVTMKQYYNIIISVIKEAMVNPEEIKNSLILYRVALITYIMTKEHRNGFSWKKEAKSIIKGKRNEINWMYQLVIQEINKIAEINVNFPESINMMNYLWTKEIWDNFVAYLTICETTFYEIFDNLEENEKTNAKKLQKKLIQLNNIMSLERGDVGEIINEMYQIIYEYRNNTILE